MSEHHFTNYRCLLALDPDEWPGEWEALLNDFPTLGAQRMRCWEDARESTLVSVGPNGELIDDVLQFLEAVRVREVPIPNGGVVFLDDSGQVFKTNWELRECWDWQYVLRRIGRDRVFQQCFPSSGAIIEVERLVNGVRLQHIDYEHPLGVTGSRLDLAGALLEDAGRFMAEVHGILAYLHTVAERAATIGSSEAFVAAFGVAPQDENGGAG